MEKRDWQVDTQILLRGIRKGWLWIAGGALLCMAVVLIWTVLAGDTYQMSVTFHVDNAGEKDGYSSSDLSASRDLADSCMVILQMDSFREAVAQESGVALNGDQKIRGTKMNGTEFLKVQITASDPRQVQALTRAVAKVLPEKASQILKGVAVRVADESIKPALCDPNYISRGALAFLLGAIVSAAAVTGMEVCRQNKRK